VPNPGAGQLGFDLCAVPCTSSPCDATPVAGAQPHPCLCRCHPVPCTVGERRVRNRGHAGVAGAAPCLGHSVLHPVEKVQVKMQNLQQTTEHHHYECGGTYMTANVWRVCKAPLCWGKKPWSDCAGTWLPLPKGSGRLRASL